MLNTSIIIITLIIWAVNAYMLCITTYFCFVLFRELSSLCSDPKERNSKNLRDLRFSKNFGVVLLVITIVWLALPLKFFL